MVVSVFNPWPPVWQENALSIALWPLGMSNTLNIYAFITLFVVIVVVTKDVEIVVVLYFVVVVAEVVIIVFYINTKKWE